MGESVHRHMAWALGALVCLTSCADWRQDVYTVSPALKESARRYSEVMDDFADEALLANVLRAKDNAPLNFNDLSAITGSLSLSGTLGFTWPFGPFYGSRTTNGAYKNTFSPSFTGTTSPVITLGTLNTQGFMMTMIQPISSTYILSKWNRYPHQFLLYLFVKSIRFPHEAAIRNDPDDPQALQAFQGLADTLMNPGQVEMKSLMVLDPLGDPVPVGRTYQSTVPPPTQGGSSATAPAPPALSAVAGGSLPARVYYVRTTLVTSAGESAPSGESQVPVGHNNLLKVDAAASKGVNGVLGANIYVSTVSGGETRQNTSLISDGGSWMEPAGGLIVGLAPPGSPGTQYQVSSDYQVFQTINGFTDGQLHVGNAPCPAIVKEGIHAAELCPPGSQAPFVRFYKEYPAQVALCVVTDANNQLGPHVISPKSKEETSAPDAQAVRGARLHSDAVRMMAAFAGGKPTSGSTSSGSTAGASAGTGGGGGAGGGGGGGGGASAGGGGMVQVTLALQPSRISAVLHSESCEKDQLVLPTATEEDFDDESRLFTHIEWRSIAEVIEYLGAVARFQNAKTNHFVQWDASGNPQRIFTYAKGTTGRLTVRYRSDDFSVPERAPTNGADYSLQALTLLNELISIAKISGSLPVSQPVQVLP